MSTVQDTDLLVIGRGNTPYKCTFADWKASQASVNQPALLTPADGATDVSQTPTFTSTAFSITGTGVTHASSDWQVTLSTDTGFASPVVQSMADATNLVSWTPSTPLEEGKDYIARVRHNGSGGLQSPWSDVISFKTAKKDDPIATVVPGDLYYKTTLTAKGAFIPKSTALPANSDGTAYIDIASCADDTPALLLDTKNSLWVSAKSRLAPAKATPPIAVGAKVIKICGSYQPNYYGNCLALANDGTLWRGWSLSSSPVWAQVTTAPFPLADVDSLSSQAYTKYFWLRVKEGGSENWYSVDGSAQALGAFTKQAGLSGCIQVVQAAPGSQTSPTANTYGLKTDGTVVNGGGSSVYSAKKAIKLLAGGYSSQNVWCLCEDGTILLVTNPSTVIGLPAGEHVVDFIVSDNSYSYVGAHFALTRSGKVFMTPAKETRLIAAGDWFEATDLAGKISSFGSTSNQSPVIDTQFHLILPR